MAAPLYPSTLPGVSTFAVKGLPTVQADANDIGPKNFRRVTISGASLVNVSWRFIGTDYAAFVAWWETVLLNGHKRFFIQLPSAGGITWHLSRFSGIYSASRQGYSHWQVEAELEIRERAIATVIPF